jgi:hypothetical protein
VERFRCRRRRERRRAGRGLRHLAWRIEAVDN